MSSYANYLTKVCCTIFIATGLLACAPAQTSFPLLHMNDLGINKVSELPSGSIDPNLNFCSPLSFAGITWNDGMTLTERRSLAIALSISGGFEGGSGWANITNNFDGMGLSAGLLNQTLGTDSLQPLLAEMEYSNPAAFHASFSAPHLKSILQMLQTWKTATSWQPKSLSIAMELAADRDGSAIQLMANQPHDDSVTWAKQNLYQSNGSFISSWKDEIQDLLVQPAYISLQIEAARRYHTKAMTYLQRIGIYDLRAYLVMFDIVTQNGSIKEARFVEWAQKVKALGLTSVVSKLKLLVDLRVLDSKPEWQEDVRSRKYALIDGVGRVHGKNLNLPASYCYSPTDPSR